MIRCLEELEEDEHKMNTINQGRAHSLSEQVRSDQGFDDPRLPPRVDPPKTFHKMYESFGVEDLAKIGTRRESERQVPSTIAVPRDEK